MVLLSPVKTVEKADGADDSLVNVASAISNVNAMMAEVASAIEQQSVVVHQLSDNIVNIRNTADIHLLTSD